MVPGASPREVTWIPRRVGMLTRIRVIAITKLMIRPIRACLINWSWKCTLSGTCNLRLRWTASRNDDREALSYLNSETRGEINLCSYFLTFAVMRPGLLPEVWGAAVDSYLYFSALAPNGFQISSSIAKIIKTRTARPKREEFRSSFAAAFAM